MLSVVVTSVFSCAANVVRAVRMLSDNVSSLFIVVGCCNVFFYSKCYGAGAVGIFRDGYLHGIFGQQVFDEFGPLNETDGAAIEIILIAHAIDFLKALDAVEVEVIDK
jgi:hypothetical protein